MDERAGGWRSSPAITGLLLLATLVSPVGAAFLGLVTLGACDIPWEGPYQCIVPEPIFDYLLMCWIAPFLFLRFFALGWFALCIAGLIKVTRLFGSAVWDAVEPHLQ